MNDKLIRIMDERDVSTRELARRTGLALSSIRRARKSAMCGSIHTWELIARALECGIDDVAGGR